jgi:hypothetical protein
MMMVQQCSSQDFFQGGVFNPLHLHGKKCFFFKRFNIVAKNKMCKAHFDPFSVIISPFHAVGMQWGSKFTLIKKNIFSPAKSKMP